MNLDLLQELNLLRSHLHLLRWATLWLTMRVASASMIVIAALIHYFYLIKKIYTKIISLSDETSVIIFKIINEMYYVINLAPNPLILGPHIPIPEHPVLHVSLRHAYVLAAPFN